jgi:CubicO group peptidase (beta-lactamase class C family)
MQVSFCEHHSIVVEEGKPIDIMVLGERMSLATGDKTDAKTSPQALNAARRLGANGPTMAIDNVLKKPIEAGLIPGIVAFAADEHGIIYEGAFGRRAVDKEEPMTLDSVFRIASMTKAITGTAAMQLVEKGRIGLEQPMGDVLPSVRDAKVLEGFDGEGTPQLRYPKTPITLRHLLTHTSGYGYDIFNPDLVF